MNLSPPLSQAPEHGGLPNAEDYPDASRANRRPPYFVPPRFLTQKHPSSCVAIHGDVIITARHDKIKVHRQRHGSSWDTVTHQINLGSERKELKVSVLAFKPTMMGAFAAARDDRDRSDDGRSSMEDGRYLWCGTREGDLFEFDTTEGSVIAFRGSSHTASVELLERLEGNMISVDASGKVSQDESRGKTRLAPVYRYLPL